MGSANVPSNDFVAGAVGCVLVVVVVVVLVGGCVVVVGEDGQVTVRVEELVSVPPTPMYVAVTT